MTTKRCTLCNEEKDISIFVKNKGKPDGYASWCKPCTNKYYADKREERQKNPPEVTVTEKKCTQCEQIKPLDDFSINIMQKHGRNSWCKKCVSKYGQDIKQRNIENPPARDIKEKFCSSCQKTLSIENFSISNLNADGFCVRCKSCNSEYLKKWRENLANRDEIEYPEVKRCYYCKETKNSDCFYFTKTCLDGLSQYCKECCAKRDIEYIKKCLARVDFEYPTEKQCSRCNEIKSSDEFYKLQSRRLSFYCKECERQIKKEEGEELRKRPIPTFPPDYVKICTMCGEEFPPENFRIEMGRANYLSCYCLDCGKFCDSIRYKFAKEYIEKKFKELGAKCVVCGFDDKRAIEFNHIDPSQKITEVGKLKNKNSIDIEVAKCELLCILCHRKETARQFNWYTNQREGLKLINKIKHQIGKCEFCDMPVEDGFEYCFDFDHLEPEFKSFNVSELGGSYFPTLIKLEIEKCRLLCCICHRIYTFEHMDEYFIRNE